jgi:hypothetical protein
MTSARIAYLAAGTSIAAALVACAQAGGGFSTGEEDAKADAAASTPYSEEDDAGVGTAPVGEGGAPTPKNDAGSGTDSGGNTGSEAGSCQKISNACGVDPQCGCSSVETCDLDSAGNASCVSAGTGALGRACASSASCARGTTCVWGACRPYCSNEGAACTAAGTNVCTQVRLQDGGAIPSFKVCQVDCDLRDPNACGGTNAAGTAGCVHDGQGHTDCERVGTVPENGDCSGQNRCGPGLICVYPTAQPTQLRCKKWCRVGVSADCGGQACTGFTTKAMVGSVEYGACP